MPCMCAGVLAYKLSRWEEDAYAKWWSPANIRSGFRWFCSLALFIILLCAFEIEMRFFQNIHDAAFNVVRIGPNTRARSTHNQGRRGRGKEWGFRTETEHCHFAGFMPNIHVIINGTIKCVRCLDFSWILTCSEAHTRMWIDSAVRWSAMTTTTVSKTELCSETTKNKRCAKWIPMSVTITITTTFWERARRTAATQNTHIEYLCYGICSVQFIRCFFVLFEWRRGIVPYDDPTCCNARAARTHRGDVQSIVNGVWVEQNTPLVTERERERALNANLEKLNDGPWKTTRRYNEFGARENGFHDRDKYQIIQFLCCLLIRFHFGWAAAVSRCFLGTSDTHWTGRRFSLYSSSLGWPLLATTTTATFDHVQELDSANAHCRSLNA